MEPHRQAEQRCATLEMSSGGLSIGDVIALVSLVFTIITTLCVLFIAFSTLQHTVRPNVQVKMLNATAFECGEQVKFIFEFVNKGYWYGSPTAVEVTAYFNFDPAFELHEIRFGSVQEYTSTKVRIGVGNLKFLKATGLKLSHREAGEQVHVRATFPSASGTYPIRVSAYSLNGASTVADFIVSSDAVPSLPRMPPLVTRS